MNVLTEDLKNLARAEGADLVGVAPVDRFYEAPKMTHPCGILPDAQSVVVIAIKYPDAAFDRWGKPPAESMLFLSKCPGLYDHNRVSEKFKGKFGRAETGNNYVGRGDWI